jgi:hypothetical protein
MDVAGTQDQAKNAWTTPYAFESMNGGLGRRLTPGTGTGTSSRVTLLGEGNALSLHNKGSVTVYVAWGNSSVVATTAHWGVDPGVKEVVSLPKDGSATHVAAITDTGESVVLVHRGYGI